MVSRRIKGNSFAGVETEKMKQKTYLDKLLENDRFKEKFNEEYQNLQKTEEELTPEEETFLIKQAIKKITS